MGSGNARQVPELLGPGWRDNLRAVAASATRSMLVAVPFITYDSAVWFRRQLGENVELVTLASIRAEALVSAGLDMTALIHLAETPQKARVFALPNLHAKVFVADERAAIITSGNLTRAGLDTNIECGIVLRERSLVRKVRDQVKAWTRLGSPVSRNTLDQLASLEAELRQARRDAEADPGSEARTRFGAIMRDAKPRLAGVQVGNRSANSLFGEAIRLALAAGPQPTTEIARHVADLLPDLCDDSEELVINGERYGKAWKHRLRNAQQYLKRSGVVAYDSEKKLWALR